MEVKDNSPQEINIALYQLEQRLNEKILKLEQLIQKATAELSKK